jgi:hypothetical protein
MNFPKLQMMTEAKKKADEMEFDMDMEAGEGDMDSMGDKMDTPKGMKAECCSNCGEPVDMATVMKYLKSCDADCRKEVHDKLMKMVMMDDADTRNAMDE